MALRIGGCWPAQIRSGMPEYARDPADMAHAEAEYVPPQPLAAQVSLMDRVLTGHDAWITRLPGKTEAEVRIRKLVWARSLVSPRNEQPVCSWRRLGKQFGCSDHHAKTQFIRAIDLITDRLNRPLPGPCLDTLRRIRASAAPAQVRRVLELA
jgi:hypothetical protein